MNPLRPVAGVLLAVALLGWVPAAAGFLLAPPGASWTGIVRRNSADLSVYLSLIEEVRRDGVLSRNLFTAEPHPPFQVRPLYAALGLLGRALPAVPSLALLQAARIPAGAFLLVLLALLAVRFFGDPLGKRAGFLVMALGSGLGWTGLMERPPDLLRPEVSTFLTLLEPPHFALSLGLLLAILLLLERAWTAPSGRAALPASLLCGLAGAWLGLEHPFDLLPLGAAVAGAILVLSFRPGGGLLVRLARALPLAAGAGLSLLFQVRSLGRVPVYAEWNRQNVVPSPSAPELVSALGLLLPLAVFGMHPLLRRAPSLATPVLVFIGASLACAYTDAPYQERFLEGLPLCVGLLAALGLDFLAAAVPAGRTRALFVAGIVALLSVSPLVAWAGDLRTLRARSVPQYLPDRFLDGLRAVAIHAAPGEPVLCSEFTGNLLPGLAARPVVLGHRIQTARVDEKRALVEEWLSTRASSPRAPELVRASGAGWVAWGPDEIHRARGGFDPAEAPFLERVFDNGALSLYRVTDR